MCVPLYRMVDEIVWVKMTVNRRMAKSHGYYLQHAKVRRPLRPDEHYRVHKGFQSPCLQANYACRLRLVIGRPQETAGGGQRVAECHIVKGALPHACANAYSRAAPYALAQRCT